MLMDRASRTETYKTTILAVEENEMTICGGIGGFMNNEVPKYVTQARASFQLGIPEAELGRISKQSGLGHVERAGNEEVTYFTYEELQRICALAGHRHQMQGVQ